jgi:hypothetical protein
MRNLDSKIQLPGFVCFKFQFYISIAGTFSTVSVMSRNAPGEQSQSVLHPEAAILRGTSYFGFGPILLQNYFERSGTQY